MLVIKKKKLELYCKGDMNTITHDILYACQNDAVSSVSIIIY